MNKKAILDSKVVIKKVNKAKIAETLAADVVFIKYLIISLISESVLEIDFVFRNYYYIIIYINWELVVEK